jgi:hypothetical protein
MLQRQARIIIQLEIVQKNKAAIARRFGYGGFK